MNAIVRPVTADRMCGYDEHGQFVISWRDGEHTTTTFGNDVRHATCEICLCGWSATSESLRDQTEWSLLVATVHESCLVRHCAFVQRANFARAMSDAQLRYRGFRTIANKYWPPNLPWAKAPWYEADLRDHAATIVLGRRKNVDHIELRVWDGSKIDYERAAVAFSAEGVTKEFDQSHVLIHAWSHEKVVAYLTRIGDLLGKGIVVGGAP